MIGRSRADAVPHTFHALHYQVLHAKYVNTALQAQVDFYKGKKRAEISSWNFILSH
jgi:hypothetical protein